MVRKALVSFAEGYHKSLLDIALPSFYRYASYFQYDLIVPCKDEICTTAKSYKMDLDRPISWLKIPILLDLISKYDIVLWIDADVIINKHDEDIANFILGTNHLQAFTVHHTQEGYIPNCGVWLLTQKSKDLLLDIWQQKQYINHCWWEQKANMHLMCWNQQTREQNSLSDYGLHSLELSYEWNMHRADERYNDNSEIECKFLHATSYSDRLNTMQKWRNSNGLG